MKLFLYSKSNFQYISCLLLLLFRLRHTTAVAPFDRVRWASARTRSKFGVAGELLKRRPQPTKTRARVQALCGVK